MTPAAWIAYLRREHARIDHPAACCRKDHQNWPCDAIRGIEAAEAVQNAKLAQLQGTIRVQQEAAERRNRDLDALHLVWCDGGCSDGVHRWSDALITRELVEAAERNTQRLRRWYRTAQFRMRMPGGSTWDRKRQERLAAKTDIPLPVQDGAP